jgi:hypothetical protein
MMRIVTSNCGSEGTVECGSLRASKARDRLRRSRFPVLLPTLKTGNPEPETEQSKDACFKEPVIFGTDTPLMRESMLAVRLDRGFGRD